MRLFPVDDNGGGDGGDGGDGGAGGKDERISGVMCDIGQGKGVHAQVH